MAAVVGDEYDGDFIGHVEPFQSFQDVGATFYQLPSNRCDFDEIVRHPLELISCLIKYIVIVKMIELICFFTHYIGEFGP
jgi:hypothetical protein